MTTIAKFARAKWHWACRNKLFWANLALFFVTVA